MEDVLKIKLKISNKSFFFDGISGEHLFWHYYAPDIISILKDNSSGNPSWSRLGYYISACCELSHSYTSVVELSHLKNIFYIDFGNRTIIKKTRN